jgi:hypothetical protein
MVKTYFKQVLVYITVMAALEEVLKTSFIIFCLLGISLSIENGKLHFVHKNTYIYIGLPIYCDPIC